MAHLVLLALAAAAAPPQEWQYSAGSGFVDTDSKQRKSPEEFLQHGRALRGAGRHEEAVRVFSLVRDHIPAMKETAHYERAETFFASGEYDRAYREYETFVLRFPQSARATDAKRQEMASALQLARAGRPQYLFWAIPVGSTSETGLEYLKASLRRYPREDFSPDFAQRLGKFYYELGDWDRAAAEFAQILHQYGDSPDAVLALWMLGLTAEHRFDAIDYDIKPLREARRHYERFLEEAEKMRRLPRPAAEWVDQLLPTVEKRLASVYGLMLAKQLKTAEYYDWKGYPKAARLYYRAILKDETSFLRVLPNFPETDAAKKARAVLLAAGPETGDGARK